MCVVLHQQTHPTSGDGSGSDKWHKNQKCRPAEQVFKISKISASLALTHGFAPMSTWKVIHRSRERVRKSSSLDARRHVSNSHPAYYRITRDDCQFPRSGSRALLEPWAEWERQSGHQGLRFLEVGLWIDVRLRAACERLGPFQ